MGIEARNMGDDCVAAGRTLVRVYDVAGSRPKLVRHECGPPSSDRIAERVHTTATRAGEWLRATFGRHGLDGAGSPFRIGVHDPLVGAAYQRSTRMVHLSDPGGGPEFRPHYESAETMRHELLHAVIDRESGLGTRGEQRVLHEAWAMVLQNATDDDWLVSEDSYTRAARAHPYDLARPPQVRLDDIPGWRGRRPGRDGAAVGDAEQHAMLTVAAVGVRAAQAIGRRQLSQVWYSAATEDFRATTTIRQAAAATVHRARELYGARAASAVRRSWAQAGVS